MKGQGSTGIQGRLRYDNQKSGGSHEKVFVVRRKTAVGALRFTFVLSVAGIQEQLEREFQLDDPVVRYLKSDTDNQKPGVMTS